MYIGEQVQYMSFSSYKPCLHYQSQCQKVSWEVKCTRIMPALCSMPDIAYYALNYARPIGTALQSQKLIFNYTYQKIKEDKVLIDLSHTMTSTTAKILFPVSSQM